MELDVVVCVFFNVVVIEVDESTLVVGVWRGKGGEECIAGGTGRDQFLSLVFAQCPQDILDQALGATASLSHGLAQ